MPDNDNDLSQRLAVVEETFVIFCLSNFKSLAICVKETPALRSSATWFLTSIPYLFFGFAIENKFLFTTDLPSYPSQ